MTRHHEEAPGGMNALTVSNSRELRTFEEMRARAYALLGDVEDELRSDWRTGSGPTPEQGRAAREARELITQAKAALNRAAL